MEQTTLINNRHLTFFKVFLIWLIFKVIAIILVGSIRLLVPGIDPTTGQTIMTLAELIIFISFISFKYKFIFLPAFKEWHWKHLFYSIGSLLVLIILQRIIGTYFEVFDYDSSYSITGVKIILSVILTPVFEEIFFRGFLLERALRKYTPVTSILFISLLFGLSHFSFAGIANVILSFTSGLLYGYIYYRTRSVVLCILLHALYNGLSLFLYTL